MSLKSSPGHNIDLRLLHHQDLLCQCQACLLTLTYLRGGPQKTLKSPRKSSKDLKKRFKRLAVFVKITGSRSSYLFLQQTVTNPTMLQNKAINKNLRTFNSMQNN